MPELVNFGPGINGQPLELPVATEQELLEFCNRVREAGGAEVLEALLPSRQGNANSCLIATSLNFGCSVGPNHDTKLDVEDYKYSNYAYGEWHMRLPVGMEQERMEKIAEAAGGELHSEHYYYPYVVLPEHIGHAAGAFDKGIRFNHLHD